MPLASGNEDDEEDEEIEANFQREAVTREVSRVPEDAGESISEIDDQVAESSVKNGKSLSLCCCL